MIKAEKFGWALKWYSKNKLDGVTERLMMHMGFYGKEIAIFKTRREAREFLKEKYSYIGKRSDLRKEPHGWTVPKVVKVKLTMTLA